MGFIDVPAFSLSSNLFQPKTDTVEVIGQKEELPDGCDKELFSTVFFCS